MSGIIEKCGLIDRVSMHREDRYSEKTVGIPCIFRSLWILFSETKAREREGYVSDTG
ncbi:MAG: hypothetical protein J6Z35_05425 [Lachnospiraceae bacterium]|nr:hypothetical protein [Lachnospiraceae bacterium]